MSNKTTQKAAVIEAVKTALPNFQVGLDVALQVLTKFQLEDIKNEIYSGIVSGNIEYGKDNTNLAEVRSYARSMVMNHLKKAKELNGNGSIAATKKAPSDASTASKKRSVNMDLLPEDLKALSRYFE